MAVPSPTNCCARFFRFVVWKKGKLLLKFLFYLILSVALFLAGFSFKNNGTFHQQWTLYSFDAAAAALMIKSAASLLQALWPFCYRELRCLRGCLNYRCCCCESVEFQVPSDFRNADEKQLNVLRILGQLPQVERLKDPGEALAVRDWLCSRKPTDNVYCLIHMELGGKRSSDLESGAFEFRNPNTPLLNTNYRTIAYVTPRDEVPSFRYPIIAENIRAQILEPEKIQEQISGQVLTRYWMAASTRECLRCFFYIRNAIDHYLVDELENIYKVKDIWLPPNLGVNGLLLYGELTVEHKEAGPKLSFNVIAELPGGDHAHHSPPLLGDLMREKAIKIKETNCHGLEEHYGKKEPFALRDKFGATDKTIYKTTLANAEKRLKVLQDFDTFFGSGLVFVDNPSTRAAGKSPEYCTFIANDNCSVHLIKKKLFQQSVTETTL